MREPIKTSYDRTILTMAAEGAVLSEVATATGKPFAFVYRRALTLGVAATMTATLKARKAAHREAGYPYGRKLVGYQGSRVAAALIPQARVDHAASDIARSLRAAARRVPAHVPVPASTIALAFNAGLTLDDIGAAFAVPPVEAVAAIRQHPEIRP